MKSSGSSETKIYTAGLGDLTNMTAHPYIVKSLKNLRLQNQLSNGLETWYVASNTTEIAQVLTLTFVSGLKTLAQKLVHTIVLMNA